MLKERPPTTEDNQEKFDFFKQREKKCNNANQCLEKQITSLNFATLQATFSYERFFSFQSIVQKRKINVHDT